MGEYLGGGQHFRVHAETAEDDVIDTGQLVVFGNTLDMVVRRPNRLWADVNGDLGHKRLLYDGRTARLLDFTYGTVAETEARATIEATVNDLIDRLGVVELGFYAFLLAGARNYGRRRGVGEAIPIGDPLIILSAERMGNLSIYY